MRLRLDIFRKIGKMPAQSMNAQSIGTLAHRSTGDVMQIQEWLTPQLPDAINNAAQLLFMVIALFILGPVYALIAIIATPVILFVVNRSIDGSRISPENRQLKSEDLMTKFIEGAAGYRDLVAAGRFDTTARAFGDRLSALRHVAVNTSVFGFLAGVFPFLAFTVLLFAYYFIKTSNPEAVGDMIYLGKVLSFAGLLMMIQGPAMTLINFLTETALSAPSFYEVKRLLETPDVDTNEYGRSPENSTIELDHASFSYHPDAPPILDDVSFRIEPGSYTAIIGQTGSGKTSLFYLLLRLLEPTAGEIKVGGVPLREIPLPELREYLGFIPQSPFIFDATIRENLCMGVPGEHVARRPLPRPSNSLNLKTSSGSAPPRGGVEAPVGPGGATLSGGERQRVALGSGFSCAIRRSSFATNTRLTSTMRRPASSRMHWPRNSPAARASSSPISSIPFRDADNILVLEKGCIIESGSHEELIRKDGLYREMWEVQTARITSLSTRQRTMKNLSRSPAWGVGFSYRYVVHREVMSCAGMFDFLEVPSDDYASPRRRASADPDESMLAEAAERFPIVGHGTCLSIGTAEPVDTDHLEQIAAFVDRAPDRRILRPHGLHQGRR